MVGVLVKNGVTVVDKYVFGGDESVVSGFADTYKAKHPALTVEIHTDKEADWSTAFDTVMPVQSKSQDQIDWLTAKAAGPSSAVLFLAKRIGLE